MSPLAIGFTIGLLFGISLSCFVSMIIEMVKGVHPSDSSTCSLDQMRTGSYCDDCGARIGCVYCTPDCHSCKRKAR